MLGETTHLQVTLQQSTQTQQISLQTREKKTSGLFYCAARASNLSPA